MATVVFNSPPALERRRRHFPRIRLGDQYPASLRRASSVASADRSGLAPCRVRATDDVPSNAAYSGSPPILGARMVCPPWRRVMAVTAPVSSTSNSISAATARRKKTVSEAG